MLVCSVAISQLGVLPFKRSHRMSEQSTAQFRFPWCPDLMSQGDPITNTTTNVPSLVNSIHANLALAGLTDNVCQCLFSKAMFIVSQISPKHFYGLIQWDPPSVVFIFLESMETLALSWWQVCNWPLPRSVLWLLPLISHIVFYMFCVVRFGDSLIWGSWDN